ncbi:hypothetical protein P3342_013099 [Pyrenophora teres f. teres]|nr:hypothetical protein P3342_013099 [Pyrenophora teres f. teres]
MERTPSPPRRVHTPPAPMYGDTYEPFSPRRSSRVAAQRDSHLHLHREQTSPRTRRDITPTASSKRSAARANPFALSPPSSPVSPPPQQQQQQQQLRSPRSTRRAPLELNPLDSDSDHAAPTPARRFLAATMAPGMLPTPAKTPRKRRVDDVSSTARILFPTNRPSTIEEAMPTPRKSRKTKNLYTLESFADQMNENTEKIPIYTDSKERVPTPGAQTEENPFLSKKGKAKAKAAPSKPRKADKRTVKMDEAVNRDEGMVYIFRGRKVFRKFHDDPPSGASDAEQDDDLSADDRQVRRQIGREARRPLTRSSIKPRTLFVQEIKERNLANGIVSEDEEATTDIEAPTVATPSRRKGKGVQVPSLETTPPPTVRKFKKEISFDSWSRVKSSHSSSSSSKGTKKRGGEPLEHASASKRARTRSS